jgi:VIT1/CCC1 family predicted Fe2+/Mn2+ transporter
LRDKTLAWFISNAFGVGWLFWYGVQLGKVSGKSRLLYGVLMALVSVGFLALSYFVWARGGAI